MQALIDFIIRNVMAFWPFARVYSWQLGVLVRMGRIKRSLSPGVHWRWPFVDEVFRCQCAEDFSNLTFGDIPTKDGKLVTFSANIGHRIIDPVAMYTNVYDLEQNLADLALGKLSTLITRKTWAELTSNQQSMRSWLREQMTREAKSWGVEITRVFITNLCVARPIRLLSEGGVGGGE